MKKYISQGRELVIMVKLGNTPFTVKFQDMGQYINKGIYTTTNEPLQKALESHPLYGISYWLESEGPKEIEVEAPREYDKVYANIRRTQDAKDILESEYGVERETLGGRADVLKKADELNIDFPVLRGYSNK